MDIQQELRTDLLQLDPKDFYLKHIVKSQNWYFTEYLHTPSDKILEKLDLFKEIVSSNFQINFHSIQIVGSAKTGYSLSPKKVLQPFHAETPDIKSSDIDIAIVSGKLFMHFWAELRTAKRIQYKQHYYNHLTSSIFRGYINDKDLLQVKGPSEEWSEIVRPIDLQLQDCLGFEHPITYRLYRDWDDLEDYQIIGIASARKAVEENNNV